jgi:hypothetical protein
MCGVQVGLLMVEGGDHWDEPEDPLRGEIPDCLPHTVRSQVVTRRRIGPRPCWTMT